MDTTIEEKEKVAAETFKEAGKFYQSLVEDDIAEKVNAAMKGYPQWEEMKELEKHMMDVSCHLGEYTRTFKRWLNLHNQVVRMAVTFVKFNVSRGRKGNQ